MHWCPVPSAVEGHLGLLAVLCNDRQVHILDLQEPDNESSPYIKIETSMATIGSLPGLPASVTIFAWSGTNRIVTAHTDGSIALWSLHPLKCLSRHAVHSTHVYHLATGYPSNPYLVASTPVSGLTIVIDLLDPSVETTSQTNPAIVPQPDLLQWSDHLQGFVSISPSSRPLNSTVGFFHSRAFSATMRKVIDGDALLSCLAVGVQHPFVLIAFLDGTVWACNPMHRVFAPRHYPPAWKLKLFEHEHIPRMRLGANLNPPDDPCRGVSRIKKAEEEADPGVAGAGENDEDGGLYADPEKIILREPLSRATAMAWNPNMEFACWAAISLASGLVKVMDLGVDYLPE
ncbi:Transcription factor tau subunit sfc6 like protein [Verticillium longisporum]|nr:Transcription factor tau subunit sfc6 like protein [Verticillium longisporum]